mmetsp:Transcript_8076/g.23740  ORF Transcript_8076/g.23740 Transcript_8076/m.23740 type:complete len:687 (-) Transcript_8076:397-2457(-)
MDAQQISIRPTSCAQGSSSRRVAVHLAGRPLLDGDGLQGGAHDGIDDVVDGAPPRQVVDWEFEPLHYGPDRARLGRLLHRLVSVIAGVQVRKDAHRGLARHGGVDALELDRGDGRVHGGVELDGPLDELVGRARARELRGPAHLVDHRSLVGIAGGVGEHGNARRDAEGARGARAGQGDFRELLCARVDVYGAVAVHEHLVLEEHEEDGGGEGESRRHLDELERGSHGVCSGVAGATDHAVREAVEHHGGPKVGLVVDEELPRALAGHALVLPRLPEAVHHGLGPVLGRVEEHLARVDDPHALEVDVRLAGERLHLRLVAEEGHVAETAAHEVARGGEDAHVVALGEHDALLVEARGGEGVVLEDDGRHVLRGVVLHHGCGEVLVEMELHERLRGVELVHRRVRRLVGHDHAPRLVEELVDGDGGLVAGHLGHEHRLAHDLQALEHPRDRFREFRRARQEDARLEGQGLGLGHEEHGQEHLRARGGADDERARRVLEPRDEVHHPLGANLHVLDQLRVQVVCAEEHARVHGAGDVLHAHLVHARLPGQHRHGEDAAVGEGPAQARRRLPIGAHGHPRDDGAGEAHARARVARLESRELRPKRLRVYDRLVLVGQVRGTPWHGPGHVVDDERRQLERAGHAGVEGRGPWHLPGRAAARGDALAGDDDEILVLGIGLELVEDGADDVV